MEKQSVRTVRTIDISHLDLEHSIQYYIIVRILYQYVGSTDKLKNKENKNDFNSNPDNLKKYIYEINLPTQHVISLLQLRIVIFNVVMIRDSLNLKLKSEFHYETTAFFVHNFYSTRIKFIWAF